MNFIDFSMVWWTFTFLILRSFSELSKGSVELFWATLTFILALKKLLGGSLGAANGSLRAHNHLTDSMDRNFGALEDLLEALLVASRCPRDLHNLQIWCPELFRRGFSSISTSPQLIFSSQTEILSSKNSFQSLQPLSNKAPLAIDLISLLNKWATKHTTQLSH